MFELTWTPMSVAEYADYERRVNGQSLCWVGRVWWHRVRPLFYRPLFLHESLDGEAPLPAWASALGGAQYPVPPGTPANSSVHLLVHERSASYSLEDLPPNSRRYARRGLQAFTIEAVPDAETLTRLGHPVYLDFLSRTGYRFNARRRDPERFRAWAEALYRFPKVRILGAFQGSELAAVLICFQVRDVVYYSTQFGNQTALKNNANDLLLHTVKVGVARSPDVRVLFAATAGMPRSWPGRIDGSERGCPGR